MGHPPTYCLRMIQQGNKVRHTAVVNGNMRLFGKNKPKTGSCQS